MDLQITWQDRNDSVDHFEVHRTDTPVAFKDLGDPLATVPSGTFSYLDETAIRNEVYYYSIVAVKGVHRVMSQQRAYAAIPNTGPGPQELIYGDANFGIFGITKRLELLSRDQLLDQLPDFNGNTVRDTDEWVKYMWRGKVCFIPTAPMKRDASWEDYYNAGLVYGTDDEGGFSGGGVNQRQVVYRGPYNFRVRLPKWELVPETNGFNYTNVRSEFVMALGSLVKAEETRGLENYRDRDGDIYVPTVGNHDFFWMWGGSSTNYARYPIHAELYGSIPLFIGDGYYGNVTQHHRPARNSRHYHQGWFPVLELEF